MATNRGISFAPSASNSEPVAFKKRAILTALRLIDLTVDFPGIDCSSKSVLGSSLTPLDRCIIIVYDNERQRCAVT